MFGASRTKLHLTHYFRFTTPAINLWPRFLRNITTVQVHLPNHIYTNCSHQPAFRWWQLIIVRSVRASRGSGFVTGWNVWVYARNHRAVLIALTIERGLDRDMTALDERFPPYTLAAIKSAVDKAIARQRKAMPEVYEKFEARG